MNVQNTSTVPWYLLYVVLLQYSNDIRCQTWSYHGTLLWYRNTCTIALQCTAKNPWYNDLKYSSQHLKLIKKMHQSCPETITQFGFRSQDNFDEKCDPLQMLTSVHYLSKYQIVLWYYHGIFKMYHCIQYHMITCKNHCIFQNTIVLSSDTMVPPKLSLERCTKLSIISTKIREATERNPKCIYYGLTVVETIVTIW